jgi:hypothetical protein
VAILLGCSEGWASTAAPHAEWEVYAVAHADLAIAKERAALPFSHWQQGILALGGGFSFRHSLLDPPDAFGAAPWPVAKAKAKDVSPAAAAAAARTAPQAVGDAGAGDLRLQGRGGNSLAFAPRRAQSLSASTVRQDSLAARSVGDPPAAASPAALLLVVGLAGLALIARRSFGK